MEKPKPKKLPKLKPNELRFAETYVKLDFNGTKAVKAVYGVQNEEYARLKAHRLITKDNVAQAIEAKRETLKTALVAEGVTPQKIAKTVNELLDANDYTAKDKGLKHATNIYGVEDPELPKGNTTYINIFSPGVQDKIKAIEAEIKQKLINPDVKTP